MFAVSSVDATKCYDEMLNTLQPDGEKPLKIATIFSCTANEEQDAVGEILDESFDVTAMESTAKEFLDKVINDYNDDFRPNFSLDSSSFQNYHRDLAKRVKSKEIDLIIVFSMFLTRFDAPTLNTSFVDKNLRFHRLIQAYSRTNRIYDATKTFGNIVTFRNLKQATIKAITLFGDKNTKNVILEKSYDEYIKGFKDTITNEEWHGFINVVKDTEECFLNPENIAEESDKKAFVRRRNRQRPNARVAHGGAV